jgi:acetyl-CoA acetyltransferase family protein
MFSNVEIPYGAYWSTPFARWQGSFAHLHSLLFASHVAKRELERKEIPPEIFDHTAFGTTTPQMSSFNGAAWLMSEIGAPEVGGPMIGQACATSARCLATSAQEIELGGATCSLALAADRTSNAPVIHYPDPDGFNGMPEVEFFMVDNFMGKSGLVPFADIAMVETAENCAREWQIDTSEQHDVVLRRYEQYQEAVGSGFHDRYMTLPFEVPDKRFRKTKSTLDNDEGIYPTDAEKLAKLKPVVEGGTVTLGGQTHPADGNAAIIVTTPDKARELSANSKIRIRLLSVGQARSKIKFMPHAPVPASKKALDAAGLSIDDIDVVKSHNPFAVNDIVFARETGRDVMTINNNGCSLIWGHPNGPTGMRAVIEMIEELVMRGGGYGLFQGCAAGDLGMAVVIQVSETAQ